MIDYEALAQEAMRGVVRQVLTRTAKSGLPGEHHFYISFDTQNPGVLISKRLKEKYPEEMTIVLQHRFWDLAVTDDRFEVKLTFDSIPERLVVPFQAIKVFFDPSVRYGLQFEDADQVPGAGGTASQPLSENEDQSNEPDRQGARQLGPRKRPQRRPRLEKVDLPDAVRPVPGPTFAEASSNAEERGASQPKRPPATAPVSQPPAKPADLRPVPTPAPGNGGAEIVSLSDFRKK